MNFTNYETVAVSDRALLGEGLFETLRIRQAKAEHAKLHWQRLKSSAKMLTIDFDLSFEAWDRLIHDWIKQQHQQDGGLKIILTGGIAERSLTAQGQAPGLLFQSFPVSIQKNPLKLMSATWLRDAANPLYRVKSINYLEAILARKAALAKGFDDALFFNTKHGLTEATTANIFLISENTIKTPPIDAGILPGITRGRLIDWLSEQAIPCEIRALRREDLETAEAVFLSSSLQGVQAVQSFEQRVYRLCHPLLLEIQALFNPF